MRISDWSSDVCSSDLHQYFFHVGEAYWPRMRAEGGQRSWTAMIYLNTLEEGGETSFPALGFGVSPRAGLLLMWNNMRPDGSPKDRKSTRRTPVTNAHLVCRLLLEKKNKTNTDKPKRQHK